MTIKKRTLASKPTTLTKQICEVQSQVDYLPLETIQQVIAEQSTKGIITDYAYGLHDKDVDDSGREKEPHYHVYLRFKNPQKFTTVASWFKIKQEYVRKIETNFERSCAYLIHRNDASKYQYDSSIVAASFDYNAFLEKLLEEEQEQLYKGNKKEKIRKQIFDEAQAGVLRGYNFHEKFNLAERIEFRPHLDKVVSEIIKTKLYTNEDRNLEVIYITGGSGCGKTSYAKEIAKARNLYYAISAEDRDPLESYDGQPCIIIDEARPSSMKLANFLKLIDNNTESLAGARYRGKTLIECRLIIITSILPIEDFFKKLQDNDRETSIQIKRRCKTKLTMTKSDFTIERWNIDEREYRYVGKAINPIPKLYNIHKKTDDELRLECCDILGLNLSDIDITPIIETPIGVDPPYVPTIAELLPSKNAKEITPDQFEYYMELYSKKSV